MNDLMNTIYRERSIRWMINEEGAPEFLASDVAAALEHTNARRAIQMHCKEKGVTKRYTPGIAG